MLAHDVIIIDDLPKRIEERIVNQAINYALISISFTFNSMDIHKLNTRVQNIAKGKIAELIFQYFMKENKLEVNFDSCQTPFYMPNKRDFVMAEYEWDIKNSFIRSTHELSAKQLIDLPALIPNRQSTHYFRDQWEKRKEMKHNTSQGVRYVFTFMERPLYQDFISIQIHDSLLLFYENLKNKFPGKYKEKPPFTDSWFWNEVSKINFPTYELKVGLRLYISAWAGEENFKYFYNTERENFDDMIYTNIRNRTIKAHRLPAFSGLFPKLKKEMKHGRFPAECL